MNDRPTAVELIDAVRHYLEKELLPALTDARLRFQTLVAANVLSVAGRELASEELSLGEEVGALAALLGRACEVPPGLSERRRCVRELNEELCARIRQGAFDAPDRWVAAAAEVRRLVVRKLEVANPRYLQAVTADEPRT
jgi:hypothetical protein